MFESQIVNYITYFLMAVAAYYIYLYNRYYMNGVLKFQGLKYTWENPASTANPPMNKIITGHTWTDISKIKSKSELNKKEQFPVYINDFRFFDKYIKEAQIPSVLKNRLEKTKFYLNSENFCRTVLGIGSAGSGKTEWLLNIMNQIHFYDKSVTFEKKGDFSKLFFRDGIDTIVNPKMEKGVIHDILSEDIQYIEVYINTIMNSTLGKSQDYFSGSAKQKLQKFLQEVKIEENNLTVIEKWDLFLTLFDEAFDEAQNSDQKSEKDVMSTVKSTMDILYLTAYRIKNGAETFTVKDFFNNPNSCRIFLNATDSSLNGLLAATTAVLIKYQLAMPNHWSDKVVPYFLDEYLSLDRIIDKDITTEMTEVGRSKNIASFKFIQNLPEKQEDIKRLISNVQYLAVFSATDTTTNEQISKFIGKVEYEYKKENISYNNGQKGSSVSIERNTKELLNPHTIHSLQEEGFSHVLFAPKEKLLFKGYTPQVKLIKRDYDSGEISLTKFYEWKLQRESNLIKKGKDLKKGAASIIEELEKDED